MNTWTRPKTSTSKWMKCTNREGKGEAEGRKEKCWKCIRVKEIKGNIHNYVIVLDVNIFVFHCCGPVGETPAVVLPSRRASGGPAPPFIVWFWWGFGLWVAQHTWCDTIISRWVKLRVIFRNALSGDTPEIIISCVLCLYHCRAMTFARHNCGNRRWRSWREKERKSKR